MRNLSYTKLTDASSMALVLVDPMVSGNEIFRFFSLQGLTTIVFISEVDDYRIVDVTPYPYDYMFYSDRDLESDCAIVREILSRQNKTLLFVMGSNDAAAVYAEVMLSALMPALSNGDSARIRTDKYALNHDLHPDTKAHFPQQTLKPHESLESARQKASAVGYPLIIKPRFDGAGSVGFYTIHTPSELEQAVAEVFQLHPVGQAGLVQEIVLQPFLQGDLYAVNTASYQGNHFIASIFRHDLHNHLPTVGWIISPQNPVFTKLSAFTKKLLSNAGFRNGINHIEIMDTGDMFTLDFNPRPTGGHGAFMRINQAMAGFDELSFFYHLLIRKKPPPLPQKAYTGAGAYVLVYPRDENLDLAHYDRRINLLSSNKVYTLARGFHMPEAGYNNARDSIIRVVVLLDHDAQVIRNDIDLLFASDKALHLN